MFLFKNMTFNKYALIHVTSPNLKIHLSGQNELELIKDTLLIIGKRVKIIELSTNIPISDVIFIDDEDIEHITRFLPNQEVHHKSPSPSLFVGPRLLKEERLALKVLRYERYEYRRACILLFIFSRMDTGALARFLRSYKTSSLTSEKVSALIEKNLSFPWKIKDIAIALHISESSLRRKLKEEGYTFTQIILDIKMNNALRMIDCTSGNMSVIATLLGYKSTSYFIASFKKYFDVTPKQFYLQTKRQNNSAILKHGTTKTEQF